MNLSYTALWQYPDEDVHHLTLGMLVLASFAPFAPCGMICAFPLVACAPYTSAQSARLSACVRMVIVAGLRATDGVFHRTTRCDVRGYLARGKEAGHNGPGSPLVEHRDCSGCFSRLEKNTHDLDNGRSTAAAVPYRRVRVTSVWGVVELLMYSRANHPDSSCVAREKGRMMPRVNYRWCCCRLRAHECVRQPFAESLWWSFVEFSCHSIRQGALFRQKLKTAEVRRW